MDTYIFSQLTEETLEKLVTLNEKYSPPAVWEKMRVALTPKERRRLNRSSRLNFHLITTEFWMQQRSSNF